MNEKKTKFMVTDSITADYHPFSTTQPTLSINGKEIEKVREFTYLGTVISADGSSAPDIKRRLGLADKALYRMRKIVWNRSIARWVRMQVVKSFIYPVATYGCETWTLRKADRETLRIWWMKIIWRLYGTWLTQKVRNDDIIGALRSGNIVDMVEHRRRRYVGHIYRYPYDRIVKQALGATWTTQGNAKRRGKALTWIDMVKKDLTGHDLDLTVTKEEWRNKISELYMDTMK